LDMWLEKYEETFGFPNEAHQIYRSRNQLPEKNRKVTLILLWCASRDKYGPCSPCPTGDILRPFIQCSGTFQILFK